MNKILTALVMVGMTCFGANAQTVQNSCGTSSDKVCRISADKKSRSCYKTKYAENYKICRNNRGYFVCCEAPDKYNSTHPGFSVPAPEQVVAATTYYNVAGLADNAAPATQPITQEMIAPQSQSYPPNYVVYAINNGISYESSSSYEGYYPEKGKIKVCYYGDNVAEDSRMPYQGCPSPQYDGPEKNAQRNINANYPADLPPLNGWGK